MASTGKCEYCGSTLLSTDRLCPQCGAPNPNYIEPMERTVFLPKTIEELKEYCAERGMPLLRMRFFIGEASFVGLAYFFTLAVLGRPFFTSRDL